jgi:hypothetical protein
MICEKLKKFISTPLSLSCVGREGEATAAAIALRIFNFNFDFSVSFGDGDLHLKRTIGSR